MEPFRFNSHKEALAIRSNQFAISVSYSIPLEMAFLNLSMNLAVWAPSRMS